MNCIDTLNTTMERLYKNCRMSNTNATRNNFIHQAFGAVEFACAIDPTHEEFYTQFWMDEENGWRKKFYDLMWEVCDYDH